MRSILGRSRVTHFMADLLSFGNPIGSGGGEPERLCVALLDRLPVDIAEEGIHIFRGGGAVIHVKAVLIHIEREQRHAGDCAVHMIPRPMVVQRAGVEIVDEYAPTRYAGKTHAGAAEVGLPRSEEHTPALKSLMRN